MIEASWKTKRRCKHEQVVSAKERDEDKKGGTTNHFFVDETYLSHIQNSKLRLCLNISQIVDKSQRALNGVEQRG